MYNIIKLAALFNAINLRERKVIFNMSLLRRDPSRRKEVFSCAISPAHLNMVHDLAQKLDISASELGRIAITEYLQRQGYDICTKRGGLSSPTPVEAEPQAEVEAGLEAELGSNLEGFEIS